MKTVLSILFVLFSMTAFCQSDTSAVLTGTVLTKAPDATIVSQVWTQISGPATALLTPQGIGKVLASGLIAGVFVLQFKVTDNFGQSGTINKKITVLRYNQPPTADAGGDIIIQLGKSN